MVAVSEDKVWKMIQVFKQKVKKACAKQFQIV